MRKIVIFTGKSIYKRETVSNKNIGLLIEYWYTSTIGMALLVWLLGLFPDWSPLLPYMADGIAHYAEKVGDTQQYICVFVMYIEEADSLSGMSYWKWQARI